MENNIFSLSQSIHASISIYKPKFSLSKDNNDKYKITFYDSIMNKEIVTINFNSLEDIMIFTSNTIHLIQYQDTKCELLASQLYSSIPNEYNNVLSIYAYYKYQEEYPIDNDDVLGFYITSQNSIYNTYAIMLTLDITDSQLEEFIIFIYNFLDSNNIDIYKQIKDYYY